MTPAQEESRIRAAKEVAQNARLFLVHQYVHDVPRGVRDAHEECLPVNEFLLLVSHQDVSVPLRAHRVVPSADPVLVPEAEGVEKQPARVQVRIVVLLGAPEGARGDELVFRVADSRTAPDCRPLRAALLV